MTVMIFASLTEANFREMFGMVLQDTWLFKGSIEDNIRYGKLDATHEEVVAAANAAYVHRFVQTLPGGYNMELNEEASNVSQGQKQLLTIARAILADPPIMILDEATSSVDTRTEVRIQKAMDNLMKGRTSFIIAHRLSTIRDADLILVMKDGDIVEQGNHEELLQKNGFYAELYNSQFERSSIMKQRTQEEIQRLDRQFDFIREIDKEKFIGRQTYLSDGVRKENDAEHAWHMAIMTILLSEYAGEEIDVLKTVTMLLLHDIVEIDAGDTYAYDEEAKKTQREREVKAADRIFGMLPDDQGKRFRELWEEFEARETKEAKFARTMDNLQPMMLNAATDGKAWVEHAVHLSQIMKRNERTAEGSEVLWEYARERFIQPNIETGKIKTK